MTTLELAFLNRILLFVAIVVGIANICLLSGLFYFYWNSYKQLKSKFTTGLLYFAVILLAQNILAIIALAVFLILGIEVHEIGGTEVYSVLLLVTSAQFIALTILFKITWE
jgi:hypothetical protein